MLWRRRSEAPVATDGGLRPLFLERLREGIHWQSVETGSIASGVPDSNYCARGGIEGWVEYKQTEAWAVKFREGQTAWARRRASVGGRVFLAVRRRHSGGPRIGDPVDELWVYLGQDSHLVEKYGLRGATPLVKTEGGPSRWDWSRVRQILTT